MRFILTNYFFIRFYWIATHFNQKQFNTIISIKMKNLLKRLREQKNHSKCQMNRKYNEQEAMEMWGEVRGQRQYRAQSKREVLTHWHHDLYGCSGSACCSWAAKNKTRQESEWVTRKKLWNEKQTSCVGMSLLWISSIALFTEDSIM